MLGIGTLYDVLLFHMVRIFNRSYSSVIVCMVRTFTFSFFLFFLHLKLQLYCVCVYVMCYIMQLLFVFSSLLCSSMFSIYCYSCIYALHARIPTHIVHIVHCTSLTISMYKYKYYIFAFCAATVVALHLIRLFFFFCFVPFCNS